MSPARSANSRPRASAAGPVRRVAGRGGHRPRRPGRGCRRQAGRLDRRISSIDGIVTGAAQRGRANTAAGILVNQRKARAALVVERQQAAQALADLKVERGGVQARVAIFESEAMPLRDAAELLGMGGDDERAIRLLIALMVLCCDPLAIALTAAVSARRSTTA
jgi:hypothetical protein